MKKIKDTLILNPLAGNDPFETVKDYSKTGRESSVPLTIALAIRDFIKDGFGATDKNITILDSSHALRIINAINSRKDGILEIEDGDFDWLKLKLEQGGGKVFGMFLKLVMDALS